MLHQHRVSCLTLQHCAGGGSDAPGPPCPPAAACLARSAPFTRTSVDRSLLSSKPERKRWNATQEATTRQDSRRCITRGRACGAFRFVQSLAACRMLQSGDVSTYRIRVENSYTRIRGYEFSTAAIRYMSSELNRAFALLCLFCLMYDVDQVPGSIGGHRVVQKLLQKASRRNSTCRSASTMPAPSTKRPSSSSGSPSATHC